MAQVYQLPADNAAQPEVTPEVKAIGTGIVTSVVLPSAMPSWPKAPWPTHCVPGWGGFGQLPSLWPQGRGTGHPQRRTHPSSRQRARSRRWRRCA